MVIDLVIWELFFSFYICSDFKFLRMAGLFTFESMSRELPFFSTLFESVDIV